MFFKKNRKFSDDYTKDEINNIIEKFHENTDKWENGELGNDVNSVTLSSHEEDEKLKEMISR